MYSINLRHKQTNRLLTLTFHNRQETELFIRGWDASALANSTRQLFWCPPFRFSVYKDVWEHGAELQPEYDILNILTPAHERITHETIP